MPEKSIASQPAFSLIELLVVIGVIALLCSLLLPTLSQARAQARNLVCSVHLAQLGHAFHMYAVEYRGRAMPLVYSDKFPEVYWWGTDDPAGVDHTRGFVWPYLPSDLRPEGLFECPNQPWGTYDAQGEAKQVTSTYGYNGYYLCPPHAGYQETKRQPWKDIDQLYWPDRLFTFGDTLIDMGGRPRNNTHLDPPFRYYGRRWMPNDSPTTTFRHNGRANILLADGHVEAFGLEGGSLQNAEYGIGSVGPTNDPHYVPDWREWSK